VARSILVRFLATAVLLALGAGPAAGEPCSPAVVGVRDRAAIDAFVAAVRKAAGSSDPGRMAALVRLPLRVNSRDQGHGQVRTRYFRAADELREYAGRIFSRRLRGRVSGGRASEPICRRGSLGFAGGLLWATPGEDGRLLLSVVNNDEFQWPGMERGELLRCQTADHLVVVDRPRSRVRYRSWPLGPSSGKADLVLERGVESWEGSGKCLVAVWTFTHGRRRIVVRAAGCGGAEARAPVGFVSVLEAGGARTPGEAEKRDCLAPSSR
jgi:hypothetical protein